MRQLAGPVSFSLAVISFKEKYFVQRNRVIVFFNDIPEVLNRLQDTLLVMSAQGLAQYN
jgi:hypothetical protein